MAFVLSVNKNDLRDKSESPIYGKKITFTRKLNLDFPNVCVVCVCVRARARRRVGVGVRDSLCTHR